MIYYKITLTVLSMLIAYTIVSILKNKDDNDNTPNTNNNTTDFSDIAY